MSLVVEQLIYSSFPQLGFKYIASANVPLAIQQAFYQQIVSQLWDAYNPPDTKHKGVYIYQIDPNKTLFGWLINDGNDEFGRANIPYFHCYYLTESLDAKKLVRILASLEMGPFDRISRDNDAISILTVTLSDNYRSNAFELGVKLSKDIRLFSHRQLREEKLLQWFVSAKEIESKSDNTYYPVPDSLATQPDNNSIPTPTASKIERILEELANKPIAIEGILLVSSEGQPLTPPIGIDANSVLILAGTMLYLANNTREELVWPEVEQVSIRGQQGHVILTACTADTFLLVKTGKALSGLLEGEIHKTRSKLQSALENADSSLDSSLMLAQLEPQSLSAVDTLLYDFDLILETEEENDPDIRYRGRSMQ